MKTILLLDDEPEVLTCLVEMLQRLNYRVLTETDGSSALSRISAGASPDLVITDHRMPGMDGLEFVSALRAMLPSVPVVMFTAYGSLESYLTAGALGVFQYVLKPVTMRELERTVSAALRYDAGKNACSGRSPAREKEAGCSPQDKALPQGEDRGNTGRSPYFPKT